jgi:hypothetical protein
MESSNPEVTSKNPSHEEKVEDDIDTNKTADVDGEE